MKEITNKVAQKISQPIPLALICTLKPDGETNIATVAWWTYLSNNPSMIGFAINKRSYSYELICLNKEAVVCLPSERIAKEVMMFGRSTGRTENKIAQNNLSIIDLENSKIQVPKECRVIFICDVEQVLETGDHAFVVCEVLNVLENNNENILYAWESYSKAKALKI